MSTDQDPLYFGKLRNRILYPQINKIIGDRIMFHLNSFVNEVKDIGRQMAEKIDEPFDEECLYIHPYDEGEMSIQYWGHKRNAEVVIEMANLNEITYYDPDEIEEI